ncbi:MAG: response regulator [Eubacteriales bacterium]
MYLLFVDDDMHTLEVIKESVDWKSLGMDKVFTASSASQAKRIIKNNKIDIIVSDIEMPKESGLDLLVWIRKSGIDVEFILLTCHEKFEYAASAIKWDAAGYLTKPFDADIMKLSIKKTIAKIEEKRKLKESSLFEEWMLKNTRQEQLHFWLILYSGIIKQNRERISKEIEVRKLKLDTDKKYRLIMTKITDYENQLESLGDELLYFSLENVHSNILCGQDENYCVVRKSSENDIWLLTTILEDEKTDLEVLCKKLTKYCDQTLNIKATCCIGNPCHMEELYEKAAKLEDLILHNIVFYGNYFLEDNAMANHSEEAEILDVSKLTELLDKHDKVALLNYIKEMIRLKTNNQTLDERSLYMMKQEILQATYAHLLQSGIQATKLFYDETSAKLSGKAEKSSIDMIRWASYLLERSFSYEKEIAKTSTLIDRINSYIHENYKENIGRNELATVFFLAPEYLAKLYYKKTGKYLNDYIREYRIEKAKWLLKNTDGKVSDIAQDVGFDNYSYFSTLFKKNVGMSPNEYRQNS